MSYSDSLNHTITTSVSIRVTPVKDYLVSWSILWSCFVVASIVAAWQVYREHRIFKLRHAAAGSRTGHEDESAVDVALADGESVSTADLTRSLVRLDVVTKTSLSFTSYVVLSMCSNRLSVSEAFALSYGHKSGVNSGSNMDGSHVVAICE
jgi:hypothetical protein